MIFHVSCDHGRLVIHSCPRPPAIFHHFAAFLSRPALSQPAASSPPPLLLRRRRRSLNGIAAQKVLQRCDDDHRPLRITFHALRLLPRQIVRRPLEASLRSASDRVIYYKSDIPPFVTRGGGINLSASPQCMGVGKRTPHNLASERAGSRGLGLGLRLASGSRSVF